MITQLPNKSNSNSIAASSGCRLMMLGLASHETRSTGEVSKTDLAKLVIDTLI